MLKLKFIRFVFNSGIRGLGGAVVATVLFGIALYEHASTHPPIPPVSQCWFVTVGIVALFFGAYAAWSDCEDNLNLAIQGRDDAKNRLQHVESALDTANGHLLIA